MSLNAQERRKIERAEVYKRQAGRQWRPEGKTVNCSLPKTLRITEDYFSPARWRVIEAMTTKAPAGSEVRLMPEKFWHSTMSYGAIAARAGVSVKTVRNTIKQARELGLIRIFETLMQGGRRKNTHYLIEAYEAFLAAKRKDPRYFHTAEGHLVGTGRNPCLLTPEGGKIWNLNPLAPPPPRSAGPIAPRRAAAGGGQPRRSYSALDIEAVRMELNRAQTPTTEDGPKRVLDVAQRAYADVGVAGDIDAELVAALISAIGHEYKPNRAYPVPTLGWFLKNLPDRVKSWLQSTGRAVPHPHARTG